MAFASGSNHGLRYIREDTFGVTPNNPVMRDLRHTSCSLVLTKDSFQSNELRRDAQISDLRHGMKKNGGDIGIELSFGEYDDLLAAVVRSDWKDNVLVAGIKVPTFTLEREFADIGQYQLFTGCAVNTLSLEIQANAMITGTINFVGKDVLFGDQATALYSEPSRTESPLDGFSGTLKEGGVEIAVITSISLQIENGITTANVLNSATAAALIPARINCTGTVSAYFENLDLLNKFVNETESELEITLGTGGPGSYIIRLPRIKYSGGDNPADGEGPIMLNMPFQALLDECTGTNILIERIPVEEDVAEPCLLEFDSTVLRENAVITATLSGGQGKTFAGRDGVALPGVNFTNIPTGLTVSAIRRSDTTAEITLTGTAGAPAGTVADARATFTATAFSKGFCKCEGDTVQNGSFTFSISFEPDVDAPQLATSEPANGAVDVPVDSSIMLNFAEPVQPGTGNITISDNAGDTRIVPVN